jgi:hypothetical protein
VHRKYAVEKVEYFSEKALFVECRENTQSQAPGDSQPNNHNRHTMSSHYSTLESIRFHDVHAQFGPGMFLVARGGLQVDVTCSWSNPLSPVVSKSELDRTSKANKILPPGDGFIRADFCGIGMA